MKMTQRPLMLPLAFSLTMALGALAPAAHAERDLSPKEQYSIDSKRANERYLDDKKLCAEERSSSTRMQCTRDAKAEYDKAMARAKENNPHASTASCHDCGRVVSVHERKKAGEGGAMGLIGGGVAGALLGNQVGSGHGRQLATLAGAAGGAYAGKKVEEQARSTQVWDVEVQYENGQKGHFEFTHNPGFGSGDQVRKDGNTIVRR
jgi:outer membrane lipoprotein SlyB